MIITGYKSAKGHVLGYDPRRDVDHVRPYAIAICGRSLNVDRLSDGWRRICRVCLDIAAKERRTIRGRS